MPHLPATLAASLLLTTVVATPSLALTPYTITDLGAPLGGSTTAYGLNNHGNVVGAITTGDTYNYGTPVQHAFLYSNGQLTDLNSRLPYADSSTAAAINDSGQIAGTYDTSVPSPIEKGFLLNGSSIVSFGPASSGMNAISPNGRVAGWCEGYAPNQNWAARGTPPYTSYIDRSGRVYANVSSIVEGPSNAFGVNDNGQVVGQSDDHAFLGTQWPPTDLGTLGGPRSSALAINAVGQVVGWAEIVNHHPRAFLYFDGIMGDLGTLGGPSSWAYAINSTGQIIGMADTLGGSTHPFLYSNGTMTDLTSLLPLNNGWTLTSVTAINDIGQIAGSGINPAGQSRAFLLTPLPDPAILSLVPFFGPLFLRTRRTAPKSSMAPLR